MPVPGGLLQAVRQRYRAVLARNLQLPLRQRRLLARKQHMSLGRIMEALGACHENETLQSIARALSTPYGNEAYRATLFRHFAETLVFDEARARRHEVGAEAVAERQNRLMQAAVFPYLEKLCVLHSPTLRGDDNAMLRALASRKAGVTVQLFPQEPLYIVVEVDEALNKQTIYVGGPEYDRTAAIQRVDSAELESQRGTILHREWLNAARSCLDTLTDESRAHRARGTVVVGHGVGGAIATALALMLQAENFPIRNVVTFGAPKVVEEVQERYLAALNAVRVVLEGDPLVDVPVSGSEGGLFHHIGECLLVDSDAAKAAFRSVKANQKKNVKAQQQQEQQQQRNAAATDDDDHGVYNSADADSLFDILGDSGPASAAAAAKSPTPEPKTTRSSQQQQRRDDHMPREPEPSADDAVLNKPYSVLAYRIALADTDATLQYFEEDAAVWEGDERRDAIDPDEHANQQSADDEANQSLR